MTLGEQVALTEFAPDPSRDRTHDPDRSGDADGIDADADDLRDVLELVRSNTEAITRITEIVADDGLSAERESPDDLPNQDLEIRGFD